MRAMASQPARDDVDLEALTFDELAELPDRQFRSVVNADLRKDASNERVRGYVPAWITEALQGPLAARRLTALHIMLANVEGQIELKTNAYEIARAEGKGNERALKAAHLRDLAGALRFRSALREAMPEAERLATDRRVESLERAIRAHRRAIEADTNLTPSTADEALWAIVSAD